MTKKQAKFKDSSGIVDSSDYTPKLSMPGAHDIVEVQEESWSSIIFGWAKGALAFVAVAFVLIGLLYSGLAAFLMSYVPTDSESSSRSWVVRGTWSETGNQPPFDSTVVISKTVPSTDDWIENIKIGWIGITDPAVVLIKSTPFDELHIFDGKVTNVNSSEAQGKLVSSLAFDSVAEDTQSYKLKNQYLVECVSGSCEAGTYFIIDENHIYGEVRK